VFGNFGKSGASAYVGFFRPEPTLFYSRRIGRAPQGSQRDLGDVRRRPPSSARPSWWPDAERLDAAARWRR